ncbi:MAG: hypothetical protein K2R98_08025 [Gemmataceae bacterium]|nr:hypothetical protein [Gemmataceae bacterium]
MLRVSLLTVTAGLSLWLLGTGSVSPHIRAADKDDEEPKLVPGGFGMRDPKIRAKFLKDEGGNEKSEAAVVAGLKWLVRHQANDGSWNPADFAKDGQCNCDNPGYKDEMWGTTMGLLPLLAAGQTHKGRGQDQLYAKNVERALKWMLAKQDKDGKLSGNGYVQGMATIALCEAYGMTGDAFLKRPAQSAINVIVEWQGQDGGFRYAPKQAGDMSVSS